MNTWQPSAPLANLHLRAQLMQRLRAFFADRSILEIDPPLLQSGPNLDHGVSPFSLADRYLATSPEHPLKRLICAGSGAIWSLAPCFRQGEQGRRHNPEFRMVEWYRPDWDDAAIAQECLDLIAHLLQKPLPITSLSWRQAYQTYIKLDPSTASNEALAQALGPDAAACQGQRAPMLDLLLSRDIEPQLGHNSYCLLTDYPSDQVAQARLRQTADGPVAARFEIYHQGLELANGYHECKDAKDLRLRLQAEAVSRKPTLPIDERYLAAIEAGIGDCAGVALGFDRICMLAAGTQDIADILPFAWDRA